MRTLLSPRLLLFPLFALGAFACGGATADGPSPIGGPLQGHVVDANGAPFPHTQVIVAGTLVETDDEGAFTLADAPATYDVLLRMPAANFVYAMEGLRTRTPTIATTWLVTPTPLASVTLQRPALPAEIKVLYSVHALGAPHASGGIIDDQTLSFGLAGPATVELRAAEYTVDPVTGAPREYIARASDTRTVAPNDKLTWQPVFEAIAPEDRRSVQVHVDAPAGAGPIGAVAVLEGVLSSWLDMGTFATPDFSLALPPFDDVQADIQVSVAHNRTWTEARHVAPGSSVRLTLDAPVDAIAPEESAVGVTASTPLAWSSDAPAFVDLSPSAPRAPRYWVYAASGAAHLPDAAALGVPTPSGADYTWTASTASIWHSIDDVAPGVSSSPSADDLRRTTTVPRRFTTR